MNKLKIIITILAFLGFASGTVLARTHNNPPGRQNNPSSDRSNRPDFAGNREEGNEDDSDEELLIKSRGNRLNVQLVKQRGRSVATDSAEPGEEEDESDEQEVLEETEIEELDLDEDEENGLKIRANNNASLVIKNKLAAQTNFPLRVNLDTNELIVNTPVGEKTVTVLPDQAVANMLAANVLDQPGGKGGLLWLQENPTPTATISATPTSTVSATLTPTSTVSATPTTSATESASPTPESVEAEFQGEPIQLVLTDEGVLAYEIEGIKQERLLGIFKVDLNRVVFFSAETGELIRVPQNFFNRLLDLLSIG